MIAGLAQRRSYREAVLEVRPDHYWPLDSLDAVTDLVGGVAGSFPYAYFVSGSSLPGGNIAYDSNLGFDYSQRFSAGISRGWQATWTVMLWARVPSSPNGASLFSLNNPHSPMYFHSSNRQLLVYRDASPNLGWGSFESLRDKWALYSMQSDWNSGAGTSQYTLRLHNIESDSLYKSVKTATVGGDTPGDLGCAGYSHGGPIRDSFAHLIWFDRTVGDDEFTWLAKAMQNGAI